MSIVGGSNEFVDALKLLGNSDEFQRRIEQYREAQAKAEATIALAGKASEILAIREQISKELEDVKSLRASATSEAAAIVADAKKRAEELTKEASTAAEAQNASLDEAKRKANELVAEAQKRMQDVLASEKAVEAVRIEADKVQKTAALKMDEAAAAKAAYEDRKKKLDEVATSILSALRAV